VILARTRKGRGFSEIEDREGWHGRPLPAKMAERAIIELGGERHLTVSSPRPEPGTPRTWPAGEVSLPRYDTGAKVATRLAYGQALAAIGARGDIVALDGEVGNSTHSEEFAKKYPERYFEMFIAEQQLVAAPVPERRDERGRPRAPDGRAHRHRLYAHDPRRVPGALWAG
jgi:transketolase